MLISKEDLIQQIEPMLTWEMLDAINRLPEGVVRCKDCKYCYWTNTSEGEKRYYCTEWTKPVIENLFCGLGHRGE